MAKVNSPFIHGLINGARVAAMKSQRRIDRVLALARERGMNQVELARAMDVQPQHVTNWKSRDIPLTQLPRAAKVLRCSIDYLAGQESASVPLNPIEQQLIGFFRGMSEDHRNDLVAMANRWYSAAHPNDGAADPYNHKRKAKV